MAVIQDLFVDQGSTYASNVHVKRGKTEESFDLSGGTLYSSIKTYPESETSVTDFTITVLSYIDGRIMIDLTDDQTWLLKRKRYTYDIIFVNGFGQPYKVVEGIILVSPGTTRRIIK